MLFRSRYFEEWHAKRTQIISSENAPPSSPPTPPPKYRYAYSLERDLSRDPASQHEKCPTCRGDPDDNPFLCKGCSRQSMRFKCRFKNMYHLGFEHLPHPCGYRYLCPNDPAQISLPESRAPTPSPVIISDSDTAMTSGLGMPDDDEEL